MRISSDTADREKSGRGFMSGVLVLSISTFAVKLIGLAYKIPMMALLGAEGMGYFNSAYEIYALLCVISTAGLPVALSMLVSACAENKNYIKMARVYRTAMTIFTLLGALGTAFMLVFAGRLSALIENPDALWSIAAIAPALLCVCVASAVRGYFQGLCRMSPTAISQLIEALGKLILGVFFARIALDAGYGLPIASALAIVGISVGTLMSALYLLALKFFHNRKTGDIRFLSSCEDRGEKIAAKLFKIAIPITLSSAVLGVTRIIDMALIMRRLQDIGYSTAGANAVYGSYTTLAVPVFGLIPSLIAPVALALVPRLSAHIERGSLEGQSSIVSSSLRITALFAIPASAGIALYARNILELLFANESEAISTAAPLLALLGISILFASLITTTNAILQSYMKTSKPIISMAIGAAVKVVSAYILIGIPSVGVYGAPISTLLCNITVTTLNMYFVSRYAPQGDGVFKIYVRPFAAACVMMIASFAIYSLLLSVIESRSVAFIAAMAAAVAVYGVFTFLFGAVSEEDILMMPFGERIISMIKRIGLFRTKE